MIEVANEHGKGWRRCFLTACCSEGKRGKNPPADHRENLVEAIIGLPANLFYGTGIRPPSPSSTRPRRRPTCSSSTPAAGLRNGKNQNRLRDEDIDHIVRPTAALRRGTQAGHRRGALRLRCPARGDCRQRLQPQHPALCGHLRGGARKSTLRPCSRRLMPGKGACRGACRMEGYLKELGY